MILLYVDINRLNNALKFKPSYIPLNLNYIHLPILKSTSM